MKGDKGLFLTSDFSENTVKKCCFTGYRPSKLPIDVSVKNKQYNDFENSITKAILELVEQNCSVFYTGMAMGFDMLCAECVLLLRKIYKSPLKLICAIPFKEQSDYFTTEWKERYNYILNECDEVVILSDKYFKGCYQKRNKFMVDNSDYVMTWFDGKPGGTKNTVDYAIKQNRYILNLYDGANNDYYPQIMVDII